MSDELLEWYERELAYFKESSQSFARDKPKIAGRLGISDDGATKDPHVERLIQAFAYLNSRIRYKLDDDFPELTDAMLGVLYPHFLLPIPSCSTVQFSLPKEQANEVSGATINREAVLEAPAPDGGRVRFQTSADVTLFPMDLKNAEFLSPPFSLPTSSDARALFKLEFKPFDLEKNFSEYSIPRLRMFINLEQDLAGDLLECLHGEVMEVLIAGSSDDRTFKRLPASCIRPSGFEADQRLLPWPNRSFPGYRLLTEYFAFPQKFSFFDLDLEPDSLDHLGNTLQIYVLLKQDHERLEKVVSSQSILTGVAPVVNLFPQSAEVELDHLRTEYRLDADRREENIEIYSVDNVVLVDDEFVETQINPFYSIQHTRIDRQQIYWNSTRKQTRDSDRSLAATEVFLTLVDSELGTLYQQRGTIRADTQCMNRNVPAERDGWRPEFTQITKQGVTARIRCVTTPTNPLPVSLGKMNLWKIISHLSLNHLSLAEDDGLSALREILQLHDRRQTDFTQDQIAGLTRVACRKCIKRLNFSEDPLHPSGFGRGTEISVEIDNEKFIGSSSFIFAEVLDRFFSLYTSINTFTLLRVAATSSRERKSWQWEPRSGHQPMI